MNLKMAASPAKRAYSKTAFKAGQPWLSGGMLLMAFSLLASLAAGHHWIASFLRYPFLALEFVGVGVETYGAIRISRWKKANPLSQFDQGVRS